MSTKTIEFHKVYTRQSRSPWDDLSRVVMMFDPVTKCGIYLHIGCDGINGLSISKSLQTQLPVKLQKQYIGLEQIEIIMYVFFNEIADYCCKFVKESEFKRLFLTNQRAFFSDTAKACWHKSYTNYMKYKC